MFTNAIEAEGKKVFQSVLTKLEAVKSKDGHSALKEAEELFQEGVNELKEFEAKVTPSEMAAALNLLFPGKFNAAEITSMEASVSKIATAIEDAKEVETELGITL